MPFTTTASPAHHLIYSPISFGLILCFLLSLTKRATEAQPHSQRRLEDSLELVTRRQVHQPSAAWRPRAVFLAPSQQRQAASLELPLHQLLSQVLADSSAPQQTRPRPLPQVQLLVVCLGQHQLLRQPPVDSLAPNPQQQRRRRLQEEDCLAILRALSSRRRAEDCLVPNLQQHQRRRRPVEDCLETLGVLQPLSSQEEVFLARLQLQPLQEVDCWAKLKQSPLAVYCMPCAVLPNS